VDIDSASVSVTASFGVANCPAKGISTSTDLVAAADAAMYKAKRSGRNRVEIADALP
jgi:diguanylate cyclase